MNLNADELALKMLEVFKDELSDKWPIVKNYAESESKKLAENFVMIEKLSLTGEITQKQARLHHEIQRNTSRSVLLTIKGLGLITVEQAINSAVDSLRETVNGALGFVLL